MEQKKFRAEYEKPTPTLEQLEAELEAMGGFDEEPGSIVWLSVNELYPHPNNPRKELGDLTELAASISKNGVTQNLTVVKREGFGYTVIIGHRRCAAAKLAGLTALPCVIADLSEREQMGIMLAENMQRVDLTVVEQAQSMQMMLDLGETVETVSDKTGLSQKTVKDRLKLNKLDQTALKKAVAKQVSLMDLLKLDKIEDENERNKVLQKAGTNNFNEAYQKALNEQGNQEKLGYIIRLLSSFAKERTERVQSDGEIYRTFVSVSSAKEKIQAEIEECRKHYQNLDARYYADSRGATIYSKRSEEELHKIGRDEEVRAKYREQERVWEEIKEIYAIHYAMRIEFVKNIRLTIQQRTTGLLDDLLVEYIMKSGRTVYSNARETLRDVVGGENFEKDLKKHRGKVEELLIKMLYAEQNDSDHKRHHERQWDMGAQWVVKYVPSDSLKDTYRFLKRFGYEMSDEEIALRDNRHPLLAEAYAINEEIRQIKEGK